MAQVERSSELIVVEYLFDGTKRVLGPRPLSFAPVVGDVLDFDGSAFKVVGRLHPRLPQSFQGELMVTQIGKASDHSAALRFCPKASVPGDIDFAPMAPRPQRLDTLAPAGFAMAAAALSPMLHGVA